MPDGTNEQKIRVLTGGPYRVEGGVPLIDHEGTGIEAPAAYSLCRCGGSKNKPFCDGTHNSNNFNGQEFASKDTAADRAESYVGESVTIHDDRSRCSHAGLCGDNLSEVFRSGVEPWIDVNGAQAEEIIRVVSACPSGALSYSLTDSAEPVESPQGPSVTVARDAPYIVRAVLVVAGDGEEYDFRERQTLCRCGGSRNKPFCDGSHWYMGFKHEMGYDKSFSPSDSAGG
ncbi:MAG: CDGSH iron-sulfur domain-containing protein [Gemmatimonadetes bacterium]|nr:CDGSH iron-sulfur domain-containing protein [Gemmatimonadota bacterium]